MINDEYDPLAVALHEAVRALRRVELVAAMGGDDRIVRFVRPAIGVIERLASERGRGRQRERREGRLIMKTLNVPSVQATVLYQDDWNGQVTVLLDGGRTVRLPAAVFVAVAVKMVEEASQDVRSPTKAVMLYHEPPRDPYALAYTGLWCAVCGEPQFNTPSGVTCANRHGGADGVEPAGDTR